MSGHTSHQMPAFSALLKRGSRRTAPADPAGGSRLSDCEDDQHAQDLRTLDRIEQQLLEMAGGPA